RVDDLLDLARDLRLDLLGGGPGELGADAHGGDAAGGEAVHAQARPRRRPDHDERQDQHRREHWPLDADLGELLHGLVRSLHDPGAAPHCSTLTGCPAVRVPGRTTTEVPAFTPDTISTRSPWRRPVCTRTSTA